MRAAVLCVALIALAGCDQSMKRQHRLAPQGAATLWRDGPPVAGAPPLAIPQDAPIRETALQRPPAMSAALLRRGQERYAIYCAPCHGGDGGGQGVVVRRGFPPPADLRSPAMRALGAARIVAVIGGGQGAMAGFGDRIAAADRWAIAGYVKALGTLEPAR